MIRWSVSHPQRGFTLLEALITLVVVSIGLLGLLGLQAVNLSNTQVSQARSIATVLADNIAEQMRANPIGLADNNYADINNPSAGGSTPPDCRTATCTPAQIANFDTLTWDTRIAQLLPNGQGRVNCIDAVPSPGDADPCSPNSAYVITIIWAEQDKVADRGGAGDKCAALNTAGDNVLDRCFQTTFLP